MTGSAPKYRLSELSERFGLPLRGDGDHYAAYVVSAAFKGKTRVQQHQMVYQALQGRMGGELHALALQTSAPPES